ncbi:hypothetical protein AMTR_s00030p00132070 [Amborella trichopoda]|uniref:RRM domain-containing protein n=1 Tax=Amborella trichopoda TaxID=13333 RepID=U5D1H6_AMBTC|nr:hypothetical protein AMTR_s00030p00132070 [Amborella trichopoda]
MDHKVDIRKSTVSVNIEEELLHVNLRRSNLADISNIEEKNIEEGLAVAICDMGEAMEYRCFIGGLSWSTSDRGLREAFEKFGHLVDAKVVVDRYSGRSRGFGFVTFDDEKCMEEAINTMHGLEIDGRAITVDKAQPQGGSGRDRDGDRDRDRGGRDRGYGGSWCMGSTLPISWRQFLLPKSWSLSLLQACEVYILVLFVLLLSLLEKRLLFVFRSLGLGSCME